MRFYIAGRLTNKDNIQSLAKTLRELGHDVFDFSDSENRIVPVEHQPKDKNYDGNYPEALKEIDLNYGTVALLEEQKSAMKWCDICVLLLPAGADSHTDFGMAVGMNKLCYTVGEPDNGDIHLTHHYAFNFASIKEFVVDINMSPWTSYS